MGYMMIKRFLLLFTLTLALVATSAFAGEKTIKGKGDVVQYKSELSMPPTFMPNATSFPEPFSNLSNPRTAPAISTGYYFVDSYETNAPYGDSFWHPTPKIYDTNYTDDGEWIRVKPGPRTMDFANSTEAKNAWAANPRGQYYFRNPALPSTGSYFDHGLVNATDSTDNAIAGPMPLGLTAEGFIFNGVRYDSFYVSTNGIIALTNRRYLYDASGNRTIGGNGDCYDRMSMDWFVRSHSYTSSTASLNDPTPDNFGYQYAVLGNSPSSATAGIRYPGGSLNTVFGLNSGAGQYASTSTNIACRAAVIAPFYGDLHLSQFKAATNLPDDWGHVKFKSTVDGNKLIIYFANAAPKGNLCPLPGYTYTAPSDLRPGDLAYVGASAQVVLNRLDSSITVNYENFTGIVPFSGFTATAEQIFRYNTACGVLGWARHVNNYRAKYAASFQEYCQYTHYFSSWRLTTMDIPASGSAVRFKQWKNTLRVLTISYRVRSLNKDADLDYSQVVPTSLVDNYELLADEDRIGAMQPVAVLQNLTNDITYVDNNAPGSPDKSNYPGTGLNAFDQDLNFRARFRIYNQALDKIIYNRLMPIDSTGINLADDYDAKSDYYGNPYCKVRYVSVALTSGNYVTTELTASAYNGIPPYGFVEVYFPPFEPNAYVQDKFKSYTNIGRMKVEVEADPTDPRTNENFGDEWPADNKASRFLFVMKRLTSFYDDVSEWHLVKSDREYATKTAMPSVEKWVNIGTEAVQGNNTSHHPLPPRRIKTNYGYIGFTNKNSMYEGIGGYPLESPLVKMNRKTLDGQEYVAWGSPGGDELRSFPIDLRNRKGAVLAVSAQRTTNSVQEDWERGFCDGQIIGCEPRSLLNGTPTQPFNTSTSSVASKVDELFVELAKPSPDQIHGITNIGVPLPFVDTDLRGTWRYHPRRAGAAAITNMAAFSLYGGGGYIRGFLERDKDSALTTTTGLRTNIFDDGFDEYFQKIAIPIPDTFINAPNEGAKNFRFRIKVNAYDNQVQPTLPSILDDDDEMYVDNVSILFPAELTDIECSSVDIIWPYTAVPASQAKKIPIRVKIANNTSLLSPSFFIRVAIYVGTANNIQDPTPVYCKRVEMPFLSAGEQTEVSMPDWDATLAAVQNQAAQFHIRANVYVEGGDLEIRNDTTYYDVALTFKEFFAYDPITAQANNSVSAENGGNGRGLNLEGYSFGGVGNSTSITAYPTDPAAYGAYGGSASGQIATKFELFQVDTILGYQAFFGNRNSAPDYITFSIYNDQNERPSGNPIAASLLERVQRGRDDLNDDYRYNDYVTYILKEPVILPRGRYWAACAQLGETGYELGASSSRMGMRTMNVHIRLPITSSREVGLEGTSLMLHKEFREKDNYQNLLNNNIFAYENTYTSGSWNQFMPTTGRPAYAHLHHYGCSPEDNNTTWTLTRGTWNPFIRPYLGLKSPATERVYEVCFDDIVIPPVELTSFTGKARENGVDLFWETASEIDNFGFYIQRREAGNNGMWKDITFVKGNGTSSNVNRYSYCDKDVVLNKTYEYRLNQVDLNGSKDCGKLSDIVTVTFSYEGLIVLQNFPNPFTESTTLSFTLPEKSRVTLEVLDIFGNVMRTIVDQDLNASTQPYNYQWDRLCNNGTYAPNGTYIYRLTAGDVVKTGKMTVVR